MNETWFPFSSSEQLHVVISGSGPRQILLLHGFAASLHTWDDIVPSFDLEKYTLHRIDLKGHGKSSKPAGSDYSSAHFARMAAAYIESAHLRDVILIGHSLGGTISLIMALESCRIAAMVLIGSPAFPQRIPKFMRLLSIPLLGPTLFMAMPARLIATKGLESVFFRKERICKRHIERYAEFYHGAGNILGLARTVRQILPSDHGELAEKFKTIRIPALLIWGKEDRVVKTWQGEKLQALLRDARLVIIPECGHNPHEELPQNTFEIISDFLGNLQNSLG